MSDDPPMPDENGKYDVKLTRTEIAEIQRALKADARRNYTDSDGLTRHGQENVDLADSLDRYGGTTGRSPEDPPSFSRR